MSTTSLSETLGADPKAVRSARRRPFHPDGGGRKARQDTTWPKLGPHDLQNKEKKRV